jgi:hypothetical protein
MDRQRNTHAVVAELADAQASGACGRKAVEVQVLSTALTWQDKTLYRPALGCRWGSRARLLVQSSQQHGSS